MPPELPKQSEKSPDTLSQFEEFDHVLEMRQDMAAKNRFVDGGAAEFQKYDKMRKQEFIELKITGKQKAMIIFDS